MIWDLLPLRDVPVERLTWPCHDLDPAHLHPAPGLAVETGPIHVEALVDGSFFIHDGRHRAARAAARGERTVRARVLDHPEA